MRFAALLLLVVSTSAFAGEAAGEINVENVLALMNEYRAENGLGPLREDERLAGAASDRLRHMEDLGYWSHEAPDGMSPFVWLAARDYSYATAGENLASGFETVRLLVESWMESPGHRRNILGTGYTDCGIAIIDGSTKGPATGKSIVVLFASPQQAAVSVSATRP